jgi:hypothetical protein
MVRFGEVVAEVRTWPAETRAKLAGLIEKWAEAKEPQAAKMRKGLKEGKTKKGGQNPAPTTQRPAPPQGQGPA